MLLNCIRVIALMIVIVIKLMFIIVPRQIKRKVEWNSLCYDLTRAYSSCHTNALFLLI
jgi:hypothetical protein